MSIIRIIYSNTHTKHYLDRKGFTMVIFPLLLGFLLHTGDGQRINLSGRQWTFRGSDASVAKFVGPATVPGDIYTDMRDAKLIPDPLLGNNGEALQWIATSNWTYERKFNVDASSFAVCSFCTIALLIVCFPEVITCARRRRVGYGDRCTDQWPDRSDLRQPVSTCRRRCQKVRPSGRKCFDCALSITRELCQASGRAIQCIVGDFAMYVTYDDRRFAL
jgi:hypothetical protein